MASLGSVGRIPEDDFKEQEQFSQAHWITPEEQLGRFALPMAKELVYTNRDKLKGLPNTLEDIIIESVARSILRCSDLSDGGSKNRIPSLQDLAVEHLFKPNPLPQCLTIWYQSLKLIEKLPEKIPPMPNNIEEILEDECPEQICAERKRDGTAYKISEKCTLLLFPQELRNLNEFEKVVKAYGEKHYPEGENPLQFQYFWDAARQEHADKPFADTHWVLMTKDVLPGSRNKNWGEQTALVDALAREALVDYEVPTLQEAFAAITLYKVATGESLYQAGNDQNGNTYTYTRVKEATQGHRLAVGGVARSGVTVLSTCAFGTEHVGAAARRKF